VGYDEELVAFVDGAVYTALMKSSEIERLIEVGNFTKGGVDTVVKSLNGVTILPVTDSRMKTAYTFLDGKTSGMEAGGFAPAAGALNIGLLVLPRRAASLVKKTEAMRIFAPAQNVQADAYKFDYRLYYDLFIRKSMGGGIVAYVGAAA
ncbi:MAG: hypothetical protein FWF49_03430, partial [Oscillospiraceae bacterium]|nr:hypothetical protein [Oscillospiraceae bacterium]